MRKRGILYVIFLIVFVYPISAVDIFPTSLSVELNISSTYNITVNNTNSGQNANITQINITFPSSFTFIEDSKGTNALFESFVNTSNVLSWTNSSGYLINGSEWKYFWFNAIASALGDYNITVTGVNVTGAFFYNISISVNDVTNPSISFVDPTPSDDSELSQSYIPVNVTAIDNVAIDTITIELYNETGIIDSKTNSSSPFFFNFTNLANGTYRIDATTNDTSGNEDFKNRRTIILGTTVICVQNWNCTKWSECLGEIQIRSCVDFNTCGNETGKPSENQTCTLIRCVPNWNCGEWLPEKCPKNETQIRSCTDSNNCNNETGKPDETQSCIYKKSLTWLYIILTAILGIILIVFLVIFLRGRKQSSEIQPSGYQQYPTYPRSPPSPPSSKDYQQSPGY